jgi:poly [ADP-ribose] polymerase 1
MKFKIVQIFEISRLGEFSHYQPTIKYGNRRLLWHGTRLSNVASILTHGLQIAPANAPHTGHMFGKGVYFADCVSKSAQYLSLGTMGTGGTGGHGACGVLFVCEVSLGMMYGCTASQYITKLPDGFHSVWGKGQHIPDPSGCVNVGDVEIPCGHLIPCPTGGTLQYNEYIVYDISQIHMRYMVVIEQSVI